MQVPRAGPWGVSSSTDEPGLHISMRNMRISEPGTLDCRRFAAMLMPFNLKSRQVSGTLAGTFIRGFLPPVYVDVK